MTDLYEWTGVDAFGKSTTYQTNGPACITEASMVEFLSQHYPHLTITAIERKSETEWKPATGIIQRHVFMHGIIERVEAALGIAKLDEFRESLLTYSRKVATGKPADARDYGVWLQSEFTKEVNAARERAASAPKRSLLGLERSLLKPQAR